MPDAPSLDRVAVTGATGFIGGHLTRALVDQGLSPTLLARGPRATPLLDGLAGRVGWAALDLRDPDSIDHALGAVRPRVLFHLAGIRDRCAARCAEVNAIGTIRLLEAARAQGVERVVIVGSADEYGRSAGPLSEDLPPAPVSAYAASKAAATLFARALHARDGLPVVIVRPFTVYGPHQPAGMFVAQALAAALAGAPFRMSEGTQRRDFVHVADVVRGLIAAAFAPGLEGLAVNLGGGVPTPLREVARLIWELTGSRAELLLGARPAAIDETHDTWADVTLARDRLGWSPAVTLENGLAALIAASRAGD